MTAQISSFIPIQVIRVDPIRSDSESIRVNFSQSESIRIDPSRSESNRVDQITQIILIKVNASRFESILYVVDSTN